MLKYINMNKYNQTLPSWVNLLLFDIIAIPLVGFTLFLGLRDSDKTDSGFGVIIWVPFVCGLLALLGITHFFYVKHHMQESTKKTVLQIVFLLCLIPFILLVLLLTYSYVNALLIRG